MGGERDLLIDGGCQGQGNVSRILVLCGSPFPFSPALWLAPPKSNSNSEKGKNEET